MSVSDQIGELMKQAATLYRQVVATEARFEALDKEVHRMVEEMRRQFERLEAEQARTIEKQSQAHDAVLSELRRENNELRERVTRVEANMDAWLKRALVQLAGRLAAEVPGDGQESRTPMLPATDSTRGNVPAGPDGQG